MATTLELFWNLSSTAKKERIDASVKLVSALEQFQSQFTAQTASSDEEEPDAEENLEALNAQDVSYSIRRLIRGLASPRESSRLGFAVVLTELLSRLNTVTCSQIVSLILDSSKTQGSMTGQEERDMLFARLFGLSSVIQSGLLVRDVPLPSSSTATSSLFSYNQVVSCLVDLGEKKSWLRESAWWTISLAVDVLAESSVEWKEEALEATVDVLYRDNTSWTPEKIALIVKFQKLCPGRKWNALLLPTFKHTNLLDTRNLGTLAKILKESFTNDEEDAGSKSATQTGWKPQVHFVWDVLLDLLLPGPNSTLSSKGSIQEFWRIVVDESLFSSTSSPERKYWGFQIFQKALPRVNQTVDIPMLFTKNFMRSWINHLSNSDRYLHKAAKAVATDIQAIVQKNPTIGFTLVLQLTGINGSRNFDKLTKTKTVESILLSMDADGITSYIEYLLRQFNEDDISDTQAISSKRSWIISQLSSLIRHSSIPKTDLWIQTILDWFVIHGLFNVVKTGKNAFVGMQQVPRPALSDELRKEFRMKILSSLADLSSQTTLVKLDEDKTKKVPGVSSTGEFWISRVLMTIRKLEETPKNVTFLFPIEDEEGNNVSERAWEVLKMLKNVKEDRREAARGAELLLSATVLYHFCSVGEDNMTYGNDYEGSDIDNLVACIDGVSRMFTLTTAGKGHGKRLSEEAMEEESSEPIDIITDIIIGFLEKGNSYMKTVAGQAFALLSGCVISSTIDLILAQLERRNPSHDEDDEMQDLEDDGDDDSDSDELSTSSEDDDDEDDLDDEAPDLELRQRIEEALRSNGIEAATGDTEDSEEDGEDEDSEEDEVLMDDAQMMAIDEHLAEIFRSRNSEKKGSKDLNAQREATHFKNRVLDLLEIFVKKQPTSPYIVRFISPVVQLIVSAGPEEKHLSDKATGLLRSRIGKLKELPPDINPADIVSILQEVHTKARRARSSDELTTLNQCSLYLVRILLHTNTSPPVLEVYRHSLEDFLTRKASRLNIVFFQEFINRHPEIAWDLRDDFVTFADADTAVNNYRQSQAFQLVSTLLNKLPSKNDHQKDITAYMSKLHATLTTLISSACSNGSSSFTAPQIKEILKLGLAAVRQTKRSISNTADIAAIWDANKWDEIHGQLVKSDRFGKSSGLHAMCKQIRDIANSVHITHEGAPSKQEKKKDSAVSSKAKRKAGEAAGTEDDQILKKAKRTKTKVRV